MYAYTVNEALALPYGVDADITEYVNYYGETLSVPYTQAEVAYYYSSYYVALVFNYCLYSAVGLLMLLGAFRRFIWPRIATKMSPSLRKAQLAFRAHFLLSGTIDQHVMQPVGPSWLSMQVPARIHSIFIFCYVIVNIILLFTPYLIVQPNVFWPEMGYPFYQYLRYFSDRTGILSFGSTPLVILLAARNSPITWATGATYNTLQAYHRWAARVTWLNAALHTIGYWCVEFSSLLSRGAELVASIAIAMTGDGAVLEYFTDPELSNWWDMGWVGVIAGFVLVFVSLRRIRELCYEAFLILHIVSAVLWVVGCYYHVYWLDLGTDKLLRWIYAAIAFWAFDRVARMLRLLWLNGPRRRKSAPSVAVAPMSEDVKKIEVAKSESLFSAEGYMIASGDWIRLRVRPSGSWPAWTGGPGSYVFLSSLSWYQGSHPFTICWPTHMPITGENGFDDGFEVLDAAEPHSFELLLKRYSGFTKTLADTFALPVDGTSKALENNAGVRSKRVRLLIEGPYGVGHSVANFDACVIVNGGSGISAGISHLADIAKRVQTSPLRLRKVTLVWAIRNHRSAEVLAPYLARLDKLMAPHLGESVEFLDVHVYYTGRDEMTPLGTHVLATAASSSSSAPSIRSTDGSSDDIHVKSPESDAEKSRNAPIEDAIADSLGYSSTSLWRLHHHRGRPSPSVYVDATVGAKVAVSACGPPGMCDAARHAVKQRTRRDAQLRGGDDIEYIEEAFTW